MYLEVCPSTAASWIVCSWLVLVHRTVWLTCIEAHRSFMFACWSCILLTLLVPCDVSRPLEPHTWCKVPSARCTQHATSRRSRQRHVSADRFSKPAFIYKCVLLYSTCDITIFSFKNHIPKCSRCACSCGWPSHTAPAAPTIVITAERDSDKSACGSFFFSLTYDMESRSF